MKQLSNARHLAIPALIAALSPAVMSSIPASAEQPSDAQSAPPVSMQNERRTTPTIRIDSFSFRTPPSVRPGATVRVVNGDDAPHTLTSGSFNVTIPARASRTFRAPARIGTYRFRCKFHPDMRGRLVVR